MVPTEFDDASNDSVTRWFKLAVDGDKDAIEKLWDRYFTRLANIAKAKFGGVQRIVNDEEDIALSVLDSLFRKMGKGRFSHLRDRNDLWCLLLRMTQCKVSNHLIADRCQKRGSGKVYRMSDAPKRVLDSEPVESIADHSPAAEALATMSDLCEVLIGNLTDPICQEIARLKLQDYGNREIAKRLNLLTRTVDRKLKLIQDQWVQELGLDEDRDHEDDTIEGR